MSCRVVLGYLFQNMTQSFNIKKVNETYQNLSLAVKQLLDELRNVSVIHVKFTLFLELVDFHLKIDAVPPGLQINIKPLGFSYEENPLLWNEWKEEVTNCSKSLMGILRYHYLNEINHYGWMKTSLKRQVVVSVTVELNCTRESAKQFVDDWVAFSINDSINNFTDVFYKKSRVNFQKQ